MTYNDFTVLDLGISYGILFLSFYVRTMVVDN
jgi:hypothetical protein